MSRKVVLICCFALVHASPLGTDYSSATAVSYSSIRIGTPAIENNSTPLGYSTATAPVYDSLLTTQERYQNLDETHQTTFYKTLDAMNSNIKNVEANVYKAPTYTGAVLSQYIPSRSRVLNLAKPVPASRNIPQSPSPEFDSVPSILKTEGLSAYASSPIEPSIPKVYSAPVNTKESRYEDASNSLVKVQPAQTITYSAIPELYSAPSVARTEGLPASNAAQLVKVDYTESPVLSHVSVISSETNYSW